MDLTKRLKAGLLSTAVTALLSVSGHTASADHILHITYFENYAPYSWQDESKNVRGFFIDILNEVLHKRMNRQVIHEGLSRIRAQDYVKPERRMPMSPYHLIVSRNSPDQLLLEFDHRIEDFIRDSGYAPLLRQYIHLARE